MHLECGKTPWCTHPPRGLAVSVNPFGTTSFPCQGEAWIFLGWEFLPVLDTRFSKVFLKGLTSLEETVGQPSGRRSPRPGAEAGPSSGRLD